MLLFSQVAPVHTADPHCVHTPGTDRIYQWPFQEPKLEVPTTYKAYIRPM